MQTYIPEIIEVKKDSVYGAAYALKIGLEYAQECLAKHNVDSANNGMPLKNKRCAKYIEEDILLIEKAIKDLKQ